MNITLFANVLSILLLGASLPPVYQLVKVRDKSAIATAFTYLPFFLVAMASSLLFELLGNQVISKTSLFIAILTLSLSATKFLEIGGITLANVSANYMVRFVLILIVVLLTGLLLYQSDFLQKRQIVAAISYYTDVGGFLVSEWTFLALVTSTLSGQLGKILRFLSIALSFIALSYLLPVLKTAFLLLSVVFFLASALRLLKLYQT